MGEDFLSMLNILTDDEAASLFEDTQETQAPSQSENPDNNNESQEEKNDNEESNTTEIGEGNPFEDESPSESVGSEENNKGKENTSSDDDGTSSNNFYSSIASALKEEGVFPDLDDKEIEAVVEPEDFRNLVSKQIQSELDEILKRVFDALNSGVEPNVIKLYENTLGFLNSVTEDAISDESEKGEDLRRRLLQQDFMNRGYSLERAVKMTERLFASGEDIDEAKLALLSCKEYFGDKYQEILDNAKKEETARKDNEKKQAEKLKKDILSGEKIFGDITIDKATRQKIYDNISKPVYKDSETGKYYTALLKYRLENKNDYIKNVGLLFTLTDGFTNIEKLITPTAKKEVKKKLKELEHTLNNTNSSGGRMKYVGMPDTTGSNKQSFLNQGFILDMN